jgi:RNA polymerase primary sigma factor
MIQAISMSSGRSGNSADRRKMKKMKYALMTSLMAGLNPEENDVSALLTDGDDTDEDEEDDDAVSDNVGGISDEQLQQLKAGSLQKFAVVAKRFDDMQAARAKDGYGSTAYVAAQQAISRELQGCVSR